MILYGSKVGSSIAWDQGIVLTDGITTKSAERLIATPVTELTAAEGGGSRYAKPGEAAYVRAALQAAGYLVVEVTSKEARSSDDDDHYHGAWTGGKKSEGGHAKAGTPVSPADKVKAAMREGQLASAARLKRILGDNVTGAEIDDPHVRSALLDLDKVPDKYLEAYAKGGGKIAFGVGAYGSFRPDMAGKHPGGWGAGKTWNDVPGAYDPETDTAYIGNTTAHASSSIAIHELGHGMDDVIPGSGRFSDSPEFILNHMGAQMATQTAPLMNNPYYRGASRGRRETVAEAVALYFAKGSRAVRANFGPRIQRDIDAWLGGPNPADSFDEVP